MSSDAHIISWKQGDLVLSDCLDYLPQIPSESAELVLTDPPYFLDGMDSEWDSESLNAKTSKAGVVGSRPVGMKFDRQQSYRFQEFMSLVATESYRILKPGGFFISFSQARLYHRVAVSAEDAGFELRDMLAWHHNGQAKAFSQDHFVRRMKHLSESEKQDLISNLAGRKTPQLKPQLEPMTLAQKPKDGTFVENWVKHRVGLMDPSESLDGSFPGNLMAVPKPNLYERGGDNVHLTVKPIKLLAHLIRLFTLEGQTVIDPFVGSGSTALAALQSGRNFIAVEKNEDYFDYARKRIERQVAS